jgi:glutamyl-tRNA reductase
MAAGIKSQIYGENQIVAQIKDAVGLARLHKTIDSTLERLFQAALSAAKRIKTETSIAKANKSTASIALECIKSRYGDAAGVKCLVIGNGVVGRLCAGLLSRAGASVKMTLRLHRKAQSAAPVLCPTIDYEARYEALTGCDVVISATTSPHWTLCREEVAAAWDGKPRLFLDLALPRDMEPALGELPGLELLDIDSLGGGANVCSIVETDNIARIADEEIGAFESWMEFRQYNSTILTIGERLGDEIAAKAGGDGGNVKAAAEKVLTKWLFGLRDLVGKGDCPALFGSLSESVQIMQQIMQTTPDILTPAPSELGAKSAAATFSDQTTPTIKIKNWFPFFQEVTGKKALVVGGCKIALRRVKSLLNFDCAIEVIAPEICAEIEKLGEGGRLELTRRAYAEGDCGKADFVTLATDKREVNHAACLEAKLQGIPVSVADSQAESTFFFPGLVIKDNIVVGLCSGGLDHRGVSRASDKIRAVL